MAFSLMDYDMQGREDHLNEATALDDCLSRRGGSCCPRVSSSKVDMNSGVLLSAI